MLRNIIIILVSVGVVSWCLYVFKMRKNFKQATKKVTIVLGILWILTTFLPNISIILSPLTPPIKGRVIDAETRQPIVNCNIHAYWETGSAFVGSHSEAYHCMYLKTDANGEFSIPNYYKVLGFHPFPDVYNKFDGMTVVVFDHGHKYKRYAINDRVIIEGYLNSTQSINDLLTVQMTPINNPKTFFENLFDLDLNILSKGNYHKIKSDNINNYISSSYDYFITNYSITDCNILNNAELFRLSQLIESTGNLDKAIAVLKELKLICPAKATSVNEEIARIARGSNRARY